MSGYAVFQAHDGLAAIELCVQLPHIELLVLNTSGTGLDLGELVQRIREQHADLPVLHIGNTVPDGVPCDVPTLAEDFSPDTLLLSVETLMDRQAQSARTS